MRECAGSRIRKRSPPAFAPGIEWVRFQKAQSVFEEQRFGIPNRLILDALRRAGKPLSNYEVATAIVGGKGYGKEALPVLARRVRANLTCLLRSRGAVRKTGDRLAARWSLAQSDVDGIS